MVRVVEEPRININCAGNKADSAKVVSEKTRKESKNGSKDSQDCRHR
jgi:hypothetical protein